VAGKEHEGHAGGFAARAPRKIRAERKEFQGAGEEIEMSSRHADDFYQEWLSRQFLQLRFGRADARSRFQARSRMQNLVGRFGAGIQSRIQAA
jgi:hypothetical protein